MTIEIKQLGGRVTECKEMDRNGVKVGIVSGYGATWDLDRGDWWYQDQFSKGAFLKSINDHRENNNRQIRFKDHHGRTVGGIPIGSVFEDETGLLIEAEINLELQQGIELYSLIKQGVIVEFSIGFSADKFETDEEKKIRTITEATIWEISGVDEPMNPKAVITGIKSNSDLLEIKDVDFNLEAAKVRVNGSKESLKGFIGKYLIADVVDEKLVAIKNAIELAANDVFYQNDDQKDQYIVEFKKYYAKMNIDSPFSEKSTIEIDAIREMTSREFEKALKSSGLFSNKAAKFAASKFPQGEEAKKNGQYDDLLSGIKALTKNIK